MKKIGIIFPFARENGACRVPCIHSQMFTDAGYEVELIVRDSNAVFPYSGKIVSLNVSSRKGIFKILTYIELFIKIRKQKRIAAYDVVISHIPHCDLINVLTKKEELTITTVHINNDRRYSAISNRLLGYTVSRSDFIVAVSKELKNKLSQRFLHHKDKILSIYNPVDSEYIRRLADKKIPNDLINKKNIVNVGRLDVQKGQWHLLKAFSLLLNVDRYSDYSLVLIGDGPEKKRLQEMAVSLGIESQVVFAGFQDNPYCFMKNAEVFVLSSLYEGFPIVLLEAMACEVPIISYDCETGPKELLGDDGEYGVLVKDDGSDRGLLNLDIEESDEILFSEIIRILNSDNKKNALVNKYKKRMSSFSKERIMDEWELLFRRRYE